MVWPYVIIIRITRLICVLKCKWSKCVPHLTIKLKLEVKEQQASEIKIKIGIALIWHKVYDLKSDNRNNSLPRVNFDVRI